MPAFSQLFLTLMPSSATTCLPYCPCHTASHLFLTATWESVSWGAIKIRMSPCTHLWATTNFVSRRTASQTVHSRASLMALQIEWQRKSIFKSPKTLTQLAVTLLEAEAHVKSVWIISNRFLPYIKKRIRLDDYRGSFRLSRDNTYAREF